jgi:glycosyltransferase involved in cell wall biosynthesis
MRIGIDLRFLLPGRVGGSEVYVRNLLAALAQTARDHKFLVFTNDQNSHSFGLENAPHFSETTTWRQNAPLDVLFFPGTTINPLRTPVRSVVVVHDIQHVYFPQHFSLRERFRRWRRDRPSALRADRVISVSEYTRQALLETYRLPPEKVVAVYPGVSAAFFRRRSPTALDALRRRYRLPKRFILYPARFWPHKNHPRLYQALRILRERASLAVELVLCGDTPQDSLPQGVISLGRIPAEALPLLYQAAAALVFPSLYEGFGLPLLEAMAAGCPVACAQAGSLPEVGGQAAHYFDPHEPEAIAAALQRVLCDDGLRTGLVKRGLARARRFSWQRTARQTMDVLLDKDTDGHA